MNLKANLNRRHDYRFENVQRSCGHVDAVVDVTKSINSYAPSVLSGQEKMKCFACQQADTEARKNQEYDAEQFGKKFCEDHGIEPNTVRIISMNGGKSVEILIWLDVEEK